MQGASLEPALPQRPGDLVVSQSRLHQSPRLPRVGVGRVRLFDNRKQIERKNKGGGKGKKTRNVSNGEACPLLETPFLSTFDLPSKRVGRTRCPVKLFSKPNRSGRNASWWSAGPNRPRSSKVAKERVPRDVQFVRRNDVGRTPGCTVNPSLGRVGRVGVGGVRHGTVRQRTHASAVWAHLPSTALQQWWYRNIFISVESVTRH